MAALAGSQLRTGNRLNKNINGNTSSNIETVTITVPNDLIGCIIGRKGSKIAEIR